MNDRPAILVLFTLVFFGVIFYVQSRATPAEAGRERFLAPPPEQIERYTLGFGESIADGFWLRWIQDGDTCQTYRGVEAAKVDVDPSVEREFANPRNRNCDLSWSWKMLDTVTRISPRFKMPYLAGAMTLAVLVEDYEGSTRLLERGVETYPHDWSILYAAAYHHLFDLKNLTRAADLLERAAEEGGPYWLRFLAARLNTRAGRARMGLAALARYRDTLTDPKQRETVDKRLAELERQAREAPRADGP